MTTHIQWTDETWNPTVGCTRVSRGCDSCYAVRHTRRLGGKLPIYEGLVSTNRAGHSHFNGTVRTLSDRLEQPLRWRKPRRVFVNSMSDLFHEDVPDEFIDQVFAVMSMTPQHTYQILTKRPERMAAYLTEPHGGYYARQRIGLAGVGLLMERPSMLKAAKRHDSLRCTAEEGREGEIIEWPMRHVWLGTSVEDQAAADERIPQLLRCPAAVRFLSCEPLLGPVDLSCFDVPRTGRGSTQPDPEPGGPVPRGRSADVHEAARGRRPRSQRRRVRRLLGGRHRDGRADLPDGVARALEVEHDVHGFREEYQGAPVRVHLRDRKGGDPEEWPADLRVREFPELQEATR